MANQVALRALTRPGDDVIVSRESHAVWHETGGGAANAGVQFTEVGCGGRFTVDEFVDAIKPRDHMTPEIQNKFRRLMYPVVTAPAPRGTTGRTVKADVKEELKENSEERKEEGGKPVALKVNATYPSDTPLPTTPPQVLMNLPKLPEQLEYRIVGKNLIIRDVEANIIVDFVPNAIQ